jgi:hypothetical protein
VESREAAEQSERDKTPPPLIKQGKPYQYGYNHYYVMNKGLRSFQGGTTLLTEPIPSPEPQQQQEEQQQSSTGGWDTTAKVKENVATAAAKAKDFVASSKHWFTGGNLIIGLVKVLKHNLKT